MAQSNLFDPFSQWASFALGSGKPMTPAQRGATVVLANPNYRPDVAPFAYDASAKRGESGGRVILHRGSYATTSYTPDIAARTFFAPRWGAEIQSAAPGAAKLARQLERNQLPTIRPPGQRQNEDESTGYSGPSGFAFGPSFGGGAASMNATSPISWPFVAIAALALALAYVFTRRRAR